MDTSGDTDVNHCPIPVAVARAVAEIDRRRIAARRKIPMLTVKFHHSDENSDQRICNRRQVETGSSFRRVHNASVTFRSFNFVHLMQSLYSETSRSPKAEPSIDISRTTSVAIPFLCTRCIQPTQFVATSRFNRRIFYQ